MDDLNTEDIDRTAAFFKGYSNIFCLTGAGCSLASGIPTYRGNNGDWQGRQPINHSDFLSKPATRQRYWARSFLGWPTMSCAQPNAAHIAITWLFNQKHLSKVLTQNVDDLHEKSGLSNVQHLHGDLNFVSCLDCSSRVSRIDVQSQLSALNPGLRGLTQPLRSRPDGDAEVSEAFIRGFKVPICQNCGGDLKPQVVFFGDRVPPDIVASSFAALKAADALLVIGSSLKIFSGYRFCREAFQQQKPIMIINPGWTRGDPQASLKIAEPAEVFLPRLVERLAHASQHFV